ncbi:MAG TPA: hypothetical protein PLK35_00325 [Candidatus Moranbacteria bacterium]|nr:hypothetical protein [Candidatus Moranbacteria bacterium]
MLFLILALYAILVILFIITAFFIVYHLSKYSLNSSLNKIMLPIFIILSALLLLSNVLLFFSINWNSLLRNLPVSF